MKLRLGNINLYILLSLTGIFVYFPKLLNDFVIDDYVFLINNPQMHHFSISTFFDNIYVSESIYRLTSAIVFSALYALFGTNAFPYHLLQILLHIIVSLILYIYFKNFFTSKISMLASFIYLIHPINAEAVLWISSMQSQFAMIPGILALLLVTKKNASLKYAVILTILLIISLVSYEIGFIFILLLFIYTKLFRQDIFRNVVIASIVSISIYIFLRFFGGATTYYVYETFPIGELHLTERILMIPAIIFFYIKQLILPVDLLVWQIWIIKNITLSNFLLPLIIELFLLFTAIYLYIRLRNTNSKYRKLYVFFAAWLILGLIPYLQIIPIEFTVSERWFYMSFVGLLGIFCLIITTYKRFIKKYIYLFILLMMILLMLYSYRTHIRAYDWKDNITLYYHDLQIQPNNEALLYSVWSESYRKNDFKEAVKYQEKLLKIYPMSYALYTNFGNSYKMVGEFNKAIEMYILAINEKEKPIDESFVDPVSFYLSQIYTITKRPNDVLALLNNKILFSEQGTAELYMYRALASLEVGDYDNALKDAEFLKENAPGKESTNFYQLITDRIAKEKRI